MVRLHQNILIKANKEIVWSFMSDFSRSLSYNRFHSEIEIPNTITLKIGDSFTIQHRFLFLKHQMTVSLLNWTPKDSFTLAESEVKGKFCFNHKITFVIHEKGEATNLQNLLEGSSGNSMIDILWKPFVKVAMIEELMRIKTAIESSVTTHSQSFEPI